MSRNYRISPCPMFLLCQTPQPHYRNVTRNNVLLIRIECLMLAILENAPFCARQHVHTCVIYYITCQLLHYDGVDPALGLTGRQFQVDRITEGGFHPSLTGNQSASLAGNQTISSKIQPPCIVKAISVTHPVLRFKSSDHLTHRSLSHTFQYRSRFIYAETSQAPCYRARRLRDTSTPHPG